MQDAILLSRNIFLILALAPFACCSISEKIPLGAIFDQGSDDVQTAFKYAISNHNQNESGRRFELQAYVDVINTKDAFKLSRLTSFHGEFTPWWAQSLQTPSTRSTHTAILFKSHSSLLGSPKRCCPLPRDSWTMPPPCAQSTTRPSSTPSSTTDGGGSSTCTTPMTGGLNETFPGLLRLQQIYQALTPGNEPFQVKTVRRINNVTDALQFLRGLEEQSRWEHKHVVLDCSADMAKDIVVGH
ncbi:hypothetical protein YQE_09930, partial [Dendroctonus ponderosae]